MSISRKKNVHVRSSCTYVHVAVLTSENGVDIAQAQRSRPIIGHFDPDFRVNITSNNYGERYSAITVDQMSCLRRRRPKRTQCFMIRQIKASKTETRRI